MSRTEGALPTIDFRLLFESVPGRYLVLTPDLAIIAVSDAYLQSTFTTREAILGRALFEVFPDDINDPTATGVRNLGASLAYVQQERAADVMAVQRYPVRRPALTGGRFEERYWSPINVPVFDHEQKLAYIIHRVEDVTEFIYLRSRERESQQRTEELRLRTGAMEAEIFQRAQEIQEVNRRLRAANEALQQEIAARRQAEKARERAYTELEQLVQERTTALAQANAALQHERDVLEVTLASIGDAVITTDAAAVVTFLNPAAEALTAWLAPDAVGRPLTEIFPLVHEQTRHVVENPVATVLREGRAVGLANHTVLCARDGREVPIANSGAPIRDPSGQVYGTVLVFRDMSESRQAEDALRHAKEVAETADRLKSEFVATMSHELRTPLNVILGYTDMLLDGMVGALPSQQIDVLRRIARNSRVLFDLISMVLDLNRLEAGRLPVDVRPVQATVLLSEVQAELQGLCDQSGLACEWRAALGLPLFRTDPGKLKVVLKNLVSNAVKFTSEGSITIAAEEQQGGIEFSVTDTGIGISVEAQAYIFEPFRQVDGSTVRTYGGSGLGLHIVQRLLEVLGGRITVESAVGHGSIFRVWLPLAYTPRV